MLKPLNSRVLVQPFVDKSERTIGGIIIPQNVRPDSLQNGTVVAVGTKRLGNGETVPLSVAVGDIVLFYGHTAIKTKIDDIEHILLHEDDILGVVEQ